MDGVASRHASLIDAEQGSFSVHSATIAIAAWTDVKGKEKNTGRQLLHFTIGKLPRNRKLWRPT